MGNFDAFGRARGARRVDDVGQGVRRDGTGERRGGVLGDARPVRRQIDHLGLPQRRPGEAAGRGGEQHGGLGIVEHKCQALGGIAEIEGHVGTARLEIPSTPTTRAAERGRPTPTRTSGPTPSVRR